jgi:hypothetical protein
MLVIFMRVQISIPIHKNGESQKQDTFYSRMLFWVKCVVNMWSVSVLSAWLGYFSSILCIALLLKYCNGSLMMMMMMITERNIEIGYN